MAKQQVAGASILKTASELIQFGPVGDGRRRSTPIGHAIVINVTFKIETPLEVGRDPWAYGSARPKTVRCVLGHILTNRPSLSSDKDIGSRL